MTVSLDHTTLPVIDVVTLAQSGKILRAERETPPDGIPAFVTQRGWKELVSRYAPNSAAPHDIVLPALEKAVARILAHAAQAAVEAGQTSAVFTLESDLFESDPILTLAFVRDSQHPVACALVGTTDHLADILRRPDHISPT